MTTPGSNGPDQQPGGGAPGWGQPPAGSPGGYSPPPPPPGGFPQGQYPSQGQFPQGQYPPQGGAPYPQGGFGAPRKSGPPKWLIPVIAGVVLVAGALALFAFFGSSAPEVGDCLDSDSGDPEVVECDDSAAVLRIIGEHDEELTSAEFYADDSTCSAFPETEFQLWYGEVDEADAEGQVFCTQYVS